MDKTAKRITLGAVSSGIVAVCFAVTTWAMPADSHRHGKDPQRKLDHMAQQLEFSAEQREQAQAVFDTSHAAAREDREALRTLRKELRAMQAAFEADSARKIADEMGDITADIAFRRSSNHAAIYALLTEEQRVEFEEIQEKRMKKMKNRRGSKEHRRESRL